MSCSIKLILETVQSKNEEITIAGDVYQKKQGYLENFEKKKYNLRDG
ncbi:hypothetical protein LI204_04090 [Dorea formicigenerans]|nr:MULTISPECIES: hypothetical protein [Dorea]MCB6381517.1 hypothetical protein [Dorea formicigenerans]MCB6389646.1 hypothetical protein [Dorea formicigenerans]MCB6393610.1 hypothetical protein [Dorea formicigenerans]MCB6408346.1 hypothetical protein [Dorea formicigenerans]MCB6467677.1 hypothetical protein [Dorea formicigenerans]